MDSSCDVVACDRAFAVSLRSLSARKCGTYLVTTTGAGVMVVFRVVVAVSVLGNVRYYSDKK